MAYYEDMKELVVQEGDAVLRATAKPLTKKDIASPATASLIEKMQKVLALEEFGVAIAAPQVGASLRLFVVAGSVFKEDTAEGETESPTPLDRVFINPAITRRSRAKREMSEGCLSVRGKYGTVIRHEKASIQALDENAKPITYHASGLLAQIFQHECDHLDGILYIDKTIRLEKDEDMKTARNKLKENHGV